MAGRIPLMKTLATLLFSAVAFGPPSDPERVGFEVLASFDYVEGMKLPSEVTQYDLKEITVSGFMRREVAGSGPVEYFLLINDACGCTGTPKMNEILCCAMPEGETTDILQGVVKVTGKMYVGEQKEDGVVYAIYCMDVEKVEL